MEERVGQAGAPRYLTGADGENLLGCDDFSVDVMGDVILVSCFVGSSGLFAPFTPAEARDLAAELNRLADSIEPAN